MPQSKPSKAFDPDLWKDTIQQTTLAALERLIEGGPVVKVKRQEIIKDGRRTGHYKTTVTTSTRPPNVAAVIFAMERLFPERFARRFAQLPEIEIAFLPALERPQCLAVSFDFKERPKEPFPLKARLSRHLEALRDQKTKAYSPILKSC